MNHAERLELLAALSRAGVSHYKSHDLEIRFGSAPRGIEAWMPDKPIEFGNNRAPTQEEMPQNDDATEKLKELIETMKMDDASLVDKIFPAGAGL